MKKAKARYYCSFCCKSSEINDEGFCDCGNKIVKILSYKEYSRSQLTHNLARMEALPSEKIEKIITQDIPECCEELALNIGCMRYSDELLRRFLPKADLETKDKHKKHNVRVVLSFWIVLVPDLKASVGSEYEKIYKCPFCGSQTKLYTQHSVKVHGKISYKHPKKGIKGKNAYQVYSLKIPPNENHGIVAGTQLVLPIENQMLRCKEPFKNNWIW